MNMIAKEKLTEIINLAYEATNGSKLGPVFMDQNKAQPKGIAVAAMFETLQVLLHKEISESESWKN